MMMSVMQVCVFWGRVCHRSDKSVWESRSELSKCIW